MDPYTQSLVGQKRGVDESFSMDNGDDAKRMKGAIKTPSPVIHVRNLGPGVTEAELVNLASAFGYVVRTLLLPTKNQAFIQMESTEHAKSVVNYYCSIQPYIRGKPVYFQYSDRSEISLPNKPKKDTPDAPVNNILLVQITDTRVPITLENIHQTFAQYGEVTKIVTFVRNNGLQAFVEFRDVNCAIRAKQELDGKDLFLGCCTLRISFSSLNELKVKQNDHRSRDFSNVHQATFYNEQKSLLGMGQMGQMGQMGAAAMSGVHGMGNLPINMGQQQASFGYPHMGQASMGMAQPYSGFQQQHDFGVGEDGSPVLLVSNLNQELVTPDVLFTLFGVYGDVLRVKILYNKKDAGFIQFATAQQATTAFTHLNQVELFGKPLVLKHSKYREVSLPRDETKADASLTKDFTGSPLHRFKVANSKNYKHIVPPTNVLHVSNLPEGTSEEELSNLFGTCGEIQGIQFFQNDRKMALLSMKSTAEAIVALVRLHNHRMSDKYIRISFSNKSLANMQ